MRAQERAPRSSLASFGRRVDAGFEENALDGVAPDVMAEVAERAADARVAPAAVFTRHSKHELDDVCSSTRLVRPAPAGAVVLLSVEPAVPAQQRIPRHQRVELRERFAPELLGCGCEPAALRVRVRDSLATELLAQNRVLGEQVLGHQPLVSGHPALHGQQQKLQRQARHCPYPTAAVGAVHSA
jgi:hypothetical protein